jgi:hypothetical protein
MKPRVFVSSTLIHSGAADYHAGKYFSSFDSYIKALDIVNKSTRDVIIMRECLIRLFEIFERMKENRTLTYCLENKVKADYIDILKNIDNIRKIESGVYMVGELMKFISNSPTPAAAVNKIKKII